MTFSRETTVKAVRKQHRCDACLKMIEVGKPAVRWSGMTDGEFASVIMHTDCREAEIALNENRGTFGDEWLSLRDIDEDDDWQWLDATYPSVGARFGIPRTKP